MIRAAIVGGTGYTAGETLRILLNHPQVEVVSVFSTSSVGMKVSSVHTDLIGETELEFSDNLNNPDVIFLCLGHGLSREFISTHTISKECKIIDLGNDFRLEPDFDGRHFAYGLTDTFEEEIKASHDVANPGCFATAIQNAILPLVKSGIIENQINVTAITGSTGAGKKSSPTIHFSWRDNNLSIYKLMRHQHLGEINRSIKRVCNKEYNVVFVPIRGDFPRGIFASVYAKLSSDKAVNDIFKEYYKDSPFTFVVDGEISMKDVVNTNKSLLKVEVIDGFVHVTSVIDNLVKGAAGQAIENMNLLFGLERTTGLKLKPSGF
ncbi:MAG: N-acetyl-gamma-glutamyl-phosphate reductase [Bacteroidales bacterium]|nr:N-acetyl-gamma-glutamyl-phosphate reductase [Bacteroidales bacterium]